MKTSVFAKGRGFQLLPALALAALLIFPEAFAAKAPTWWEFGLQTQGYELSVGTVFSKYTPNRPMLAEGWKIHVSANPESAQQVAEVLGKLRAENINHKIVRSRALLEKMNQGDQVGKFITIYCDSPQEAKRIAKMVDDFLAGRGLTGPVVTGEKPIGTSGLVSARYGGFSKDTVTDPATGKEVKDARGQVKPDWIEDPWEGQPPPKPGEVKPPPGQPPVDEGPTSGQAGRRHPRQDLERMKAGQTPRHRLPDYKPARLEDEAVLKIYDEIVEPKTKPLKNLQNKQWLGVVDVTPDEISKQVLKKYNYELVVNKYPELLDVQEKRLPVLKRIVQEMVKEQVDQAHNARYRMWKGLPLNEQQYIMKARAFWDKHEAIKGPKSEALINQLVTLEMLTDIAVTWYDEGPATAAVHGGFALSSLLLFKALAASLTPGSTAALALGQIGTGITAGLSYLWPVVAVNLAYNTVYLAGNWTLDVLRYDTVEKLYGNPGRYNVVLDYWTFLNTYYLGLKGIPGPASRDNLFSVFPEQDDLVRSIYVYKAWYNRESVNNLNWALQPVYGYDAWLYMEQAALKDWEKGFNDFRQKVADELAIEVDGDRAKLAQLDAYCAALIQSGDLRDPWPRAMVTKIEFSPAEPKPGDTLNVKVTYAVFGLAGIEVDTEITQLVAGGGWKSKEEKDSRKISFGADSLVRIFTRESTVTVPERKELGGAETLQVLTEIVAGPNKSRDAHLALVPLPKEEKDETLTADLERIESGIAGLVKLRGEALTARGAAKAKAEALATLINSTIPALSGEIGQLTSAIEEAAKGCGEIETAVKQASDDAVKVERWEETLGKGLDLAAAKAAACQSEEDARKINELYEAAEKLFLGIINKQVQVKEIHARVQGIIDKAAEARKAIEVKKQAVDKLIAGAAAPDALGAEVAALAQNARTLATTLGQRRDALIGDIGRTRGKYSADANAVAKFDQLEQRAQAAGRLPEEDAAAAATITKAGDQAALAGAGQKLAAAKEAYAALGKKPLCDGAKAPDDALSRVETAFSTAGIYMGAAADLRGKADACLAKVREEKEKKVTALAVAPESVEMKIGESRAFTAKAIGEDGSAREVTAEATWSGGEGNRFTAKKAGSFSIGAAYQGYSGAAQITVRELQVTGVGLSPPKAAIKTGGSVNFKATATFEDGTSRDVTAEADWSPGSTFAGTRAGEFSVSAAYGGKSAAASVRVDALRVTALAVSPAQKTLKLNESVSFKAVATFEDGSTQNVTGEAVWAPDSSFTGTQEGAFNVAASYKGQNASAAITVGGPKKPEEGHKPPEGPTAKPPAPPNGGDIGQRFGQREQGRSGGSDSGGTSFGNEPGKGRTTPDDIKTRVDEGSGLMTPKPSPPKNTGTGGGKRAPGYTPPKTPQPKAPPPAGGGGCGPATSCKCAGGGAGHISCDTGKCHCGAG